MEEAKIMKASPKTTTKVDMFDEISPKSKARGFLKVPKHLQPEQQQSVLQLPPKAPKLKSRSFIPVKYKAQRAAKYQSQYQLSERAQNQSGSSGERLDMIQETLESHEIEKLCHISMVIIQQMYKESMINDKIRDNLKDMTFDEDTKFLGLFKNHTEQSDEELKKNEDLKNVVILFVNKQRTPKIEIIMQQSIDQPYDELINGSTATSLNFEKVKPQETDCSSPTRHKRINSAVALKIQKTCDYILQAPTQEQLKPKIEDSAEDDILLWKKQQRKLTVS